MVYYEPKIQIIMYIRAYIFRLFFIIKKGDYMIKVDNLSYFFPEKDLYKNISFTIEDGQHCAFIGASGTGKSTLIELIMNPEKYILDGTIELSPDCRIGYVSQFYQLDQATDLNVFDYIGGKCIELQNQLESISTEMETSLEIESLLEKYQEVSDQFDALGGHNFEMAINKKLNLANLIKLKDLKVSELSGGEFKLIQVIKEMLTDPDLMIMDEPDVFLDFENLNSLKNLINDHKGTMLVITHNRYLMNHCFDKIIHIENMELQEFDGRYIDYNFWLLQNKIELQELAHVDSEEIKRNEALIEKYRFAAEMNSDSSIGKAATARLKINERLEARRIKEPFVYIKQPKINLVAGNEIEETIALRVHDYSVAFDDIILEDVNFEIASKDKVVLIGPNGTGKTTLLREIFENNHKSIEFDKNIEVAYLSQLQSEILNDSNTIIEEFFEAGFKSSDEIISCLLDYGFSESIINQKIGSLSGGEKNILQLAKISLNKSNMLLLDEPTSHLDTYSQIALEKAIENYKGAILMVSHDFYTIVNSMDYVLIIENKTIRKMSMKKFKRMIYNKHFDRDYLNLEEKKKILETKIAIALQDNDFVLAKVLCEDLEPLIELL